MLNVLLSDCYRVQTHHFQRKQFLFFHSFNLLVLNNSTQLLYLHHAMCKRVKYFIYVGRVNSLFVLLLLSRYNNFILFFFYKSFVCRLCTLLFCFLPPSPKENKSGKCPHWLTNNEKQEWQDCDEQRILPVCVCLWKRPYYVWKLRISI